MVIGAGQVKAARATALKACKTGRYVGLVRGAGRVSTKARNVSNVEGSAIPSTRACLKWRWNAVTTSRVASS
jgi:hypothetical protein